MKNVLTLILVLVLCMSLFACSSEPETTTTTTVVSRAPVITERIVETKHVMTDVEIFASKILIEGAHGFLNPLSIKVKNVWSYKIGSSLYKFTYELEIKNIVGIMESVYYGNSISYHDLSDESLESALKHIHLCNVLTALGDRNSSYYFRENEIEAMQKGEKLDADSIQEYFLKNYD